MTPKAVATTSTKPGCTPGVEVKPEGCTSNRRTYSRHGLVTLRAAVRALGPRVIDRRTTLGKQLAAWRADLVRDLGGDVSTQQAAIIELVVRTKLMLESIDAWLLSQQTLVLARKKALLPVVRERMQLSDALARYLGQLGLERKSRDLDVAAALDALHRQDSRGEGYQTRDSRKPGRETGAGYASSQRDFEQSNGSGHGGAPVGEVVTSPDDPCSRDDPVTDPAKEDGAQGR
jgi:hypothetical protein